MTKVCADKRQPAQDSEALCRRGKPLLLTGLTLNGESICQDSEKEAAGEGALQKWRSLAKVHSPPLQTLEGGSRRNNYPIFTVLPSSELLLMVPFGQVLAENRANDHFDPGHEDHGAQKRVRKSIE